MEKLLKMAISIGGEGQEWEQDFLPYDFTFILTFETCECITYFKWKEGRQKVCQGYKSQMTM